MKRGTGRRRRSGTCAHLDVWPSPRTCRSLRSSTTAVSPASSSATPTAPRRIASSTRRHSVCVSRTTSSSTRVVGGTGSRKEADRLRRKRSSPSSTPGRKEQRERGHQRPFPLFQAPPLFHLRRTRHLQLRGSKGALEQRIRLLCFKKSPRRQHQLHHCARDRARHASGG